MKQKCLHLEKEMVEIGGASGTLSVGRKVLMMKDWSRGRKKLKKLSLFHHFSGAKFSLRAAPHDECRLLQD
jgi:hypothetical protein